MPSFAELLLRKSRFMKWGDEQIIAAARPIAADEYYRDRGISFGSLHKLLVHVMGAQWIWLERWKGNSPPRLLDATDYPTRELLWEAWPLLHRDFIEFITTQTPETIHRLIHYQNSRGEKFSVPLSELILHTLDHGTYHRGQTNTLIKLAGGQPAAVNYVQYSMLFPGG